MTPSAHDVAREIRKRLPGVGDVKVHKLLYYCQGWHLAWTGEPMFREAVEAWDNGPVVAALWHDEDEHRGAPAPQELDESALATLGYVLSRYGQLSGRDLIRLTHAEHPWREVSENVWQSGTIEHDLLAKFFRSDDEAATATALADWAFRDDRFVALVRDAQRQPTRQRDDPDVIRRRLAELTR